MIENMIDSFSTYGVLGVWTAYQIYKETTFHKEMISTLNGLKEVIGKYNK